MTSQNAKERLLSLDAFRGAAIAAMILVNNPGKWEYVHTSLRHSNWNGWTFADMIFPFFLFVVGISLTFSLAGCKTKEVKTSKIVLKIARRTLLLFLLGLLLSAIPFTSLVGIRIPGVLQRIAVCYFFSALICLKSGWRAQAAWTAGLLASYWLMMMLIPVPGVGAGILEPGKNLASYVDSILLDGHLWYNYRPFDPEGIVSTIPAIATTLFGVLTGQWLRSDRSGQTKTVGMSASGLILIALGQLLSIWLPINKGLWTSSYSIFMAGWSLVCFSVFYWLIDVAGHKRWTRYLLVWGRNPIAAYVVSDVLDEITKEIKWRGATGHVVHLKDYLFDNVFVHLASPKNASFLYAVSFSTVIFLFALVLYRKRWFLKI